MEAYATQQHGKMDASGRLRSEGRFTQRRIFSAG